MELDEILDPDEVLEIEDAMEKITGPQLCETLEELARREVALLKDPRFGNDSEMREITRWNIAALCAASLRISPDQTVQPETETSPDSPESPSTQT
jgi:hypothetical protein